MFYEGKAFPIFYFENILARIPMCCFTGLNSDALSIFSFFCKLKSDLNPTCDIERKSSEFPDFFQHAKQCIASRDYA